MEKTTYLSSIISALNKLNGMGSLNEIYDVIEKEFFPTLIGKIM
mgnify:CR=1 FL=1